MHQVVYSHQSIETVQIKGGEGTFECEIEGKRMCEMYVV
jgi:hypothetical protein